MGVLVCLAYPYSMYPIAPGVCLICAVTPSLFFAPMPTGQFGCLLVPGPDFQASLTALRCCVKTNVVPLLSARCTTVMLSAGRDTPGFALAMAGSFHLVTLPRKMPL